MDPMPLAGLFCDSEEEAGEAPKFPLSWLCCHQCGLVQVGEDIDGQDLFAEYSYASSSVPGLVRHFDDYAAVLVDRYGASSSVRLLEVGCNDGALLNKLPKPWTLMGVDPSDVARNAGKAAANYDLVSAPFTPQLVEERGWVGRWDVVTGSNCLAHISDLREVFIGVSMALKSEGWFWVEVHDLDALLRGAQWDTIYHEHKVEWSRDSLCHCLGQLGFELRELECLPLHGGLLRCGFQKTESLPESGAVARSRWEALAGLRQAYESRGEVPAVVELLEAQKRGQTIGAYGASGRANVYLNQVPDLHFSFIVDEAPLRINRFIPGVGTPIVPQSRLVDESPDKVLVTAWNYCGDIMRKNAGYQGEWLTAFSVD
ncbi:MAG: hypothetical protein M2R45_01514 [Verrucomicrobia subdivision 3 bacterium]|nr:hypothetical protein [Limisphaerales bacterium]MCS1413358.1 hypothetical protein [Limisphaerales bacterium]